METKMLVNPTVMMFSQNNYFSTFILQKMKLLNNIRSFFLMQELLLFKNVKCHGNRLKSNIIIK